MPPVVLPRIPRLTVLLLAAPLLAPACRVNGRAETPSTGATTTQAAATEHPSPSGASAAHPPVGSAGSPLPADARAIFHQSAEDRVPLERGGVTTARRGKQYLTGNEKSLFAFYETIANLGGGYVGVGSDQAYLLIGWSRPQLAWLTDYDPDVVRIHRVYRAFFLAFEDPDTFLSAWTKEAGDTAIAAIAAHCAPHERSDLAKLYTIHRAFIHRRLSTLRRSIERRKIPSYLTDAEEYAYVRQMVRHERVRPMLVNLLEREGLSGVATAARALDLPVRVLYLSNAEEYWDLYPETFRRNVEALPTDERSVLLRTLLIWKVNQDYRYNVQPLENFRQWLAEPFIRTVYDIVHARPDPSAEHINVFFTDASPHDSPRGRRARRADVP